MKTTLTSLLMLAAASPALLADINATSTPTTATPQAPTRVMGNCDMLASNTVRAAFLGVRALQTQSFDQAVPATIHVAVFQVIENIAYQRLVRYGDGALKPGTCFTVALTRDLPGQPANIADTIIQMQAGEEALLKIDHLYIFGEQEGKSIRPCSRMARRQPAGTPIVPPTTAAGVDPAASPAPVATPAPIPAPQPQVTPQTGDDEHGDDTTVEQMPQSVAPIPTPVTVPAAPAPISSGDSF